MPNKGKGMLLITLVGAKQKESSGKSAVSPWRPGRPMCTQGLLLGASSLPQDLTHTTHTFPKDRVCVCV